MCEGPEIVHINHGLGHYIGGKIYMNRVLMRYPLVYERVLDHELQHHRGYDPDPSSPMDKDLWGVIASHPSTWTHLLPIWITWLQPGLLPSVTTGHLVWIRALCSRR